MIPLRKSPGDLAQKSRDGLSVPLSDPVAHGVRHEEAIYEETVFVFGLAVGRFLPSDGESRIDLHPPEFVSPVGHRFHEHFRDRNASLNINAVVGFDELRSFSGSGVVDHGSVFLSRFRQSVGERKIRSRRRPETVGFVFFVGYLKEPNLFGSFSSLGANGRSRMSVPDSFLRSATPGRFHSDPELQCRIYFRA